MWATGSFGRQVLPRAACPAQLAPRSLPQAPPNVGFVSANFAQQQRNVNEFVTLAIIHSMDTPAVEPNCCGTIYIPLTGDS